MATNSNRLVGSQFFLTATDLDIAPASPVVGRITEGIEVLDAILALGNDASLEPTPGGGRPSAEVHLESLVVSEAR
jgi:peptidyl-prolyl cis-trans isomerase B (cyclophilin B)